ncbi:hypothetical protein [Streptomyces sp. NRRL S-118]|uniref:hypothetical protein n=1 Tax=Streptomyces sp. NRRL S-118 TaxID=1463881 RepID=UPI000694F6F3|nr:hypothetical protein [Streptomyces sp. NRRL S-118]
MTLIAEGSWATDLILPIALLIAAGAVAAYTYTRRRRRTATRTTPHGGAPRAPRPDGLDARADAALVAADDAVRSGEEELPFATLQSGEEAVRPFAEAMAYARGELAAAFLLRQRLDEGVPEDEVSRRQALEEIVARCEEAVRRLDADAPVPVAPTARAAHAVGAEATARNTAAADAVTADAAARQAAPADTAAPDAAFDAVEATRLELDGRVTTAQATLAALRERYGESATWPVAYAPDAAGERVRFAAGALERGRVGHAESAIGQAARLVEAVERRALELAEAAGRLPGALVEAEQSRGEPALADVRRAVEAGRYDPLDALRRVTEADRDLRGAPDLALLCARSAAGAADVHIGTHRAAVGPRARTRLAEARRLLAGGGSVREVLRAGELAREAQGLAEQDVRVHGHTEGGGYGGPRHRGEAP